MNRNPARPKPIVMRPCTCESQYQECNCEWLRVRRPIAGPIYIPLMALAISVLIVGLSFLFRG